MYNWLSLNGNFVGENNKIIFKGQQVEHIAEDGTTKYMLPASGNLLFNKNFSEGTITSEFEFVEKNSTILFQIVFHYDNSDHGNLHLLVANVINTMADSIGNGNINTFEIREYKDGRWNTIIGTGSTVIEPSRRYTLQLSLHGSKAALRVDGIDILSTIINQPLSQTQVGLWVFSQDDVIIHSYEVKQVKPKVFVVMEFSSRFNELYQDVIKKICDEFELEAVRADEFYSTEMIISDITREITTAKIIIADITPVNPNVFYEVGYAHALNKPTILLAENPTKLPFDVSPFRVLFYENSIRGKAKIEEGLRKHINEILK